MRSLAFIRQRLLVKRQPLHPQSTNCKKKCLFHVANKGFLLTAPKPSQDVAQGTVPVPSWKHTAACPVKLAAFIAADTIKIHAVLST